VVQSGVPVDLYLASVLDGDNGPRPLVVYPYDRRLRAHGSVDRQARWQRHRLLPCTSMAGLKLPICPNAPVPPGTTTGNVGNTRWVTSWLFSVVNSSSKPVGSATPAPMPRALEEAVFGGPRSFGRLARKPNGIRIDRHGETLGLVASPRGRTAKAHLS